MSPRPPDLQAAVTDGAMFAVFVGDQLLRTACPSSVAGLSEADIHFLVSTAARWILRSPEGYSPELHLAAHRWQAATEETQWSYVASVADLGEAPSHFTSPPQSPVPEESEAPMEGPKRGNRA